MPVATDITPMGLDHETASSSRSDSGRSETIQSETIQSEITQPSSIDEYLTQEHEGVLQLKEAVATTLSKKSPDILMSFTDPMVSTFKAVFKGEKQLVIWCKGNAGFIGIFESHTSLKAFGFEHLVGVSIGYDGSWRVIVGAGNAFCDSRWPAVWSDPYKGLGGVYKMVVDEEGMEEAKGERAARLAAVILEDQFWKAMVDVKAS